MAAPLVRKKQKDATDPILELQDVTVAFGDDVILKDVSLKIFPRETIVLIGLSGSGKSILLKTLAGLCATLIIVTHDISRAYQMAGRIFFVGNKTLIETGSAEATRVSADPRIQQYLHGWTKGPLTDTVIST